MSYLFIGNFKIIVIFILTILVLNFKFIGKENAMFGFKSFIFIFILNNNASVLYRYSSGDICCVCIREKSISCCVNCIFRQVADDLFTSAVIFLTQLPWLSGSGSPERKSDARPFFPFSSRPRRLINDTDRTLNVVKLIFSPITRQLTVGRVSYSHPNERYTYNTILCNCSFR